MIRPVEHFETQDGQTFPTEQQAEAHAKDLLGKRLEKFLNQFFPNNIHRPSYLQGVLAMTKDPKATAEALRGILALLEFGQND